MHWSICLPFLLAFLPLATGKGAMKLAILIPDTITMEDRVFQKIVNLTIFTPFVFRDDDLMAVIVFCNHSRIDMNFSTDPDLIGLWNPRRCPGSRATHLALKDAQKLFTGPRQVGEERLVHLYLDGLSDNVQKAEEEAKKLRDSGIGILVTIKENPDSAVEAHALAIAGKQRMVRREDTLN